MKRYPHWIYPARGSQIPAAVVCVEVDTKASRRVPGPCVEHPTLVRWAAHSATRGGNDYVKARDTAGRAPEEFWALLARLAKKHSPVWVFCSRAPRVWSSLGLWDALELGAFSVSGSGQLPGSAAGAGSPHPVLGYLVLEDPVNAVQLRTTEFPGKVVMVDLRNYGLFLDNDNTTAVQRLGRAFRFVTSMIAAIGSGKLGSLQITAAAQALFTYRRRFLTHALHAHNHPQATVLEDEAYHGGRCEALRLGTVPGPVYYLDYSSLYASVAREADVPVQLKWYEEYREPAESMSLRDDPPDVADVLVETHEPLYPYAANGLVVFPVGEFRTKLAGAELARALERGHVHRVYRAAWYHKRPALREFMSYFLTRREDCRREGWKDLEGWVKRLLVGLVGKMGQRGTCWEDCVGEGWLEPWDSWTQDDADGNPTRYRCVAGRVQRQVKERWASESVPAVAAWVTAGARAKLTQALACAGWEECYYCDTDSVMCSALGYGRLVSAGLVGNGEPGKLRLEDVCQNAEIRGWKCYTAGDREACSGVPRGTLDKSGSLFYRWLTVWLADSLKTHRAPSGERKLVRAHCGRVYRHGVETSTGWVRPFVLPEELNLIRSK
jgi:hypothetical protein